MNVAEAARNLIQAAREKALEDVSEICRDALEEQLESDDAKPAQVEVAPKAKRGRKPVKRTGRSLEVGQSVRYRQGRGTFEARVAELAGDVAFIERLSDGKRVQRPISKLALA